MKTKARDLLIILLTGFWIFFLASCNTKKPVTEVRTEEKHQSGEHPTVVEITQAQFNQLSIQMGDIEMKNLWSTLKATGFLKVPPQNKADITTPIGGTVHSINVMEGARVNKGQVVARLSNTAFIKIQEEFLSAASQLHSAEADYVRQKELSEKNITAQKAFQQAESLYKSLKAKTESLKHQLAQLNVDVSQIDDYQLQNTYTVKSPIAGNVSHIDVNIGTTVDPSKLLMDVVDNSQLHLDLFIFEQDITKIRIGQIVDVSLTNLPGKHYTAKVFAVGSAFEGQSKTIPIHATITGDKTGLIEGMNVTASINIGTTLTTAVLTSAISSVAGEDFIFIQTEGHEHKESIGEMHADKHDDGYSFKRIRVKKGITQSGYTEIALLQEIPQRAKVVVNGTFYLMSMLTNRDEGHDH